MECVKTGEYHSFTCWPCVLAAAGSSRSRRFNLSLRKADVSGSCRTWEVTTANSPRGLPGPDSAEPLPSGASERRGAEGRDRVGTAPVASHGAAQGWRRDARAGSGAQRSRPDRTPLPGPVTASVSQQHLPASSATLAPRATALGATRPFLWHFPNLVCGSFKCVANSTLRGREGKDKS